MRTIRTNITRRVLAAGFLLAVFVSASHAQTRFVSLSDASRAFDGKENGKRVIKEVDNGTEAISDSTGKEVAAVSTSITFADEDTLRLLPAAPLVKQKQKRDWTTWRPNAKKALWLAIVLPGGGQIYNRKYWKLPLVYGGFVGCIYAMQWNNTMYRDYSQAYQDIMDSDPTTQSYNQFLHLGTRITSENMAQYQTIFKNRKDRYRRWRDLSFFCLIGVYALSIIDAYVDASLSEFDISDDLSLRVEPAVISNPQQNQALRNSALGIHCSLRF